MNHRWILVLWLLLLPSVVHAFEPFVIEDIRVEGLQRIALGTTFTYLPLKVANK
jgi:outer membrane protein insertion porin family